MTGLIFSNSFASGKQLTAYILTIIAALLQEVQQAHILNL